MWLFRDHRGGLEESKKTTKSFNTLQELIRFAFLEASNKCFIDDINIYLYCVKDEHIDWSPIYIVSGIDEIIGICTECLDE